uniref:Tumor protein p53-inducible protein 11 n=1 Tax=Podarcis muralis TaxID=64176 RepID=A0A670JEY7_PODMU
MMMEKFIGQSFLPFLYGSSEGQSGTLLHQAKGLSILAFSYHSGQPDPFYVLALRSLTCTTQACPNTQWPNTCITCKHHLQISQVLGNEIKFAVKEPLGLRVWQFVTAVMFSGVAIMALAFPEQLYDAVFEEESVNSKTPIRLYGGALLSISLIMWNALYTAEKIIMRWTLLTEACYFGVQFLGKYASLWSQAHAFPLLLSWKGNFDTQGAVLC